MRAESIMGVNTHDENALQIKVYFYSSPQVWPGGYLKCVIDSICDIHQVSVQASQVAQW